MRIIVVQHRSSQFGVSQSPMLDPDVPHELSKAVLQPPSPSARLHTGGGAMSAVHTSTQSVLMWEQCRKTC